MMKTGTTISIPVAMIFKKYYCHKCGCRLKRHKITKVLNPGDPGYEAAHKQLRNGDFFISGKGAISSTGYIFACPECHDTITFEEQEDIAVKQKYAKSRIL